MGKLVMIQEEDNRRIEILKKDFGIQKKIDVIRAGLGLLEKEARRLKRIKQWKKAARLVAKNSLQIHKEFQPHLSSRMKSL